MDRFHNYTPFTGLDHVPNEILMIGPTRHNNHEKLSALAYSKTPNIYRALIYRVPRFTRPICFPPKFFYSSTRALPPALSLLITCHKGIRYKTLTLLPNQSMLHYPVNDTRGAWQQSITWLPYQHMTWYTQTWTKQWVQITVGKKQHTGGNPYQFTLRPWSALHVTQWVC